MRNPGNENSSYFYIYDRWGVWKATTHSPELATIVSAFLGAGSTVRHKGKFVWEEGVDYVTEKEEVSSTIGMEESVAFIKARGNEIK